jgi:DNA-binding LytR/AlgR family response regulator
MIEIAIVEDEQLHVDQITRYLKKFEEETGYAFHLQIYSDGAEIAEYYPGGIDIILMDIQMRYMDGMTAAEAIRREDKSVIIMFITNMTQYAIRGYEVDALDYIVKPVEYFSFAWKMQRAVDRIPQKHRESFRIMSDGIIRSLPLESLLYVESYGHTLKYHMLDAVYETRATIKETEAELKKFHFFRIGNSYLVNLEKVDGIKGAECIIHGESLPVSRRKKKDFMDTLRNYVTELM